MKKFLIIILCCLAVAARAENVVSVSSANGHPQDEVTLNVALTNTDAAVAFQAEIPLGSQLTYVAGSVVLNPDRVTDHHVTAAVVNGTLRIYAYSLSLTPFVGNEGNLLSFTLKLKNEPTDYALNLSNVKLSDASGAALPVTTQSGMVTILSPKLSINTQSLNYGHVPIRSEYTKTAQVSNVGNESLTITNITFSDAVFSCPNFTETTLQPGSNASFTFKFAPMLKGAVTATATIVSNSIYGNGTINLVADPYAVNEIHVGNVTGYCDSIVELPISMNNMEDIIGFQIEFNLNTALEFVDFTLSDRKTDHVSTGVVTGTTLRLMAYSPSATAFMDEDGVLGTARFLLKGQYGNYNLNPLKAVLADANGEDALSAKYQGRITIRSPKINGNNSLDFGSTPVTETVTKEYVVRNNGNAQMRIDQVVFDQEGFAVAESFPITVNQSATTTLHVSYSREQKGDFNALMKIYSNDPQNGLKNVALSGHRYEPNSVGLEAYPFVLGDGDVLVSLNLENYSNIVALQANFNYPYQDYSVASTDFQLTDRFVNHSLYAIQTNDSTYRILILSMQNAVVNGHNGTALNITLHPIGTPSEDEYMVSVSDVVLSEAEGQNVFTGEDMLTSFSLAVTQATQFSSGWNWWSTYVVINDGNGLEMLESSLGSNGWRIQSKSNGYVDQFEYNGNSVWYGTLNGITNEQMYMVRTRNACDATMTGRVNTIEHFPITINSGWNWIGFPSATSIGINDAMSDFTPEPNDQIKSKGNGYASYIVYGTNALWYGTLSTLEPGQGYMYKSNSTESKTLVYQNNRSETPVTNAISVNTFFEPKESDYAYNMTVTAVVELDGEELRSENYELAAFAGDECRGSVRLMYVEPLDRYMAFLLVAGDREEPLRFVLTDSNNVDDPGNANESADRFTYTMDGIIGNPTEPAVIHFGKNGTEEFALDGVRVYPNPTTGSFNVEASGMRRIVVTNAWGQVVYDTSAEAIRVTLDLGQYGAGMYFVCVHTTDGTVVRKVSVTK
jgi:hypothetical protein